MAGDVNDDTAAHGDSATGESGRLTHTQWKALIAAWLGWAFDGLDGYLYVIVAVPFVAELMGKGGTPAPDDAVREKAAIIQAVFLVGWAVGGAVFGRLGDRLGRTRTLTLTVLTYAVFTGLSFFAQQWWHLLIFRFVAALGIGGEWAAGSALVAETLHSRHRAWASATLQSGYMTGCILASFTYEAVAHLGLPVRAVFLVGVAPALLTVWIRRAVPEPEHWKAAAASSRPPRIGELFTGAQARVTLLTTALTSVALTTVWSFLFFAPQIVRSIPEVASLDRAAQTSLVSRVTVIYLMVNIVANYFATYLARAIGYRAAFTLMMAASLVVYLVCYSQPLTRDNVTLVFCLTAFFSLGLFGLFPLYIPRLFPVLLRTLGAGFTYNVGRLVSAAGTLSAGVIAHHAGGPAAAVWWTGMLFIPGILVCLCAPKPLEEADPVM